MTETVIFFFDEGAGLLFLPVPIFLLRFLLIPSFINFAAVILGYLVLKSNGFSESHKDFAVCLTCFVLSTCVELTHYVFAPVLCAPVIAIYVSSVFGNLKMTRILTVCSMISLVLAGVISALELRAGDDQLLFDVSIAMIITVCSYGISSLLIKREQERTLSLFKSYQKQIELSEQLVRDNLTGLYNRKVMFDALRYEINQGSSVYLAVMDIDDFKTINDTYGHAKGDEVLVYLSSLFEKYAGGRAYPIRFGGEEFAIVFSNHKEEKVIDILEKIRTELYNHPFVLSEEGKSTHVTISSGVVKHKRFQSIEDFFKAADCAMYQAKKRGKNNIVYVKS